MKAHESTETTQSESQGVANDHGAEDTHTASDVARHGNGRPAVINRACAFFMDREIEAAWRTLCADAPPSLVETWASDLAAYVSLTPDEVLEEYTTRKHSGPRATPWRAPTPLGVRELPSFPVDVLPPVLRAFVLQVAASYQVAPDVPAVFVLGVLATAAAHRACVTLDGNYREELNAGYVVALPSGERKSAVLNEVVRPLREIELDERRRVGSEIKDASARRKLLEGKAERLRKAHEKGEADEQAAIEAALALSNFRVPTLPVLIVDDATPARLVTLLSEHGGRLGLIADEATIVANIFGRHSSDKGALDPIEGILKALANSPIRVDRATAGRDADVPSPALSIVMAVQPAVLEVMRTQRLATERGLLPRFAYSLPPSFTGRRTITGAPAITEKARTEWAEIVRAVYSLPIDRDPRGLPRPPVLELSPDARCEVIDYAGDVERRSALGGDLSPVQGWAARQTGRILRIAGALHLADWGRDALTTPMPPKGPAMAAVIIARYFEAHAFAAFGFTAGHELDVRAALVLSHWIAAGGKPTRQTDLHQMARGVGFAPELRTVLEHLRDEHGLVRGPYEQERPGPGRKPSPLWELHPDAEALSGFSAKGTFYHSSSSSSATQTTNDATCDNPGRESGDNRQSDGCISDADDSAEVPEVAA